MANCPNVLTTGTCPDASCEYEHTILTCEPCQFVFVTNEALQVHLSSDKHRRRVAGSSFASHCRICAVNITGGEKAWTQHIEGRRHLENASIQGVPADVDPQVPSDTATGSYCNFCDIVVPRRFWTVHVASSKHKSRETFSTYKVALEEAAMDKHDIVVEGQLDFDFVDIDVARAGKHHIVAIKTSVPASKCALVDMKLASMQGSRPAFSGFSVNLQGNSRSITARYPVIIFVTFKQAHFGRYEDRLELTLEDTQLKRRFLIARTLRAIVGNKTEHEALRPRAPYVPRTRSKPKRILNVVDGPPPPALTAVRYVVSLPQAKIPAFLETALAGSGSTSRLSSHIKKVFMPASLHSGTHGSFFKNLLWIEEYKMEQDIERYDIPNATLTKYNDYYYLGVPGLAEKRPSVLVGDQILVQEVGAAEGRWFEGHVHVLRQAEVGLRFHTTFVRNPAGKHFHVRFKLNRIPVRRQHQAMNSAFTEDRVLFPRVSHLPGGPCRRPSRLGLKLCNPLIASNPPQLQAVSSIVSLPRGSPPFVVFGPPGTGKTITIVEAIQQVLSANPNARVLACAPSNSAADIIATRLASTLTRHELFRFYAPSRFKDQVPDALRNYTFILSDGHFSVPPMNRLQSFRVIVVTCVSASFAMNFGMTRGHFTHIFVDEAGQATEPETFISIKTMADQNTNVVLSGDPKQLGPIIRSPIARELGLETSYLERLMNSEAYDRRTSYGKSVVKLVNNYRSHKAILEFPNKKFYDGELQPCAQRSVTDAYLDSQYLPSKKFPIVFHAVYGKDDREASSPSFFNIDEILVVKSYIQKLKEDRKRRTADDDIGVIAPYHAQCLKLRNSLRSVADGVKVGSVEEFQGQERKVIIVSTVRSSKEFVEYDLRHTLGFVANPRRFNVAVTRAQALLIIVGDPQVLSLDPLWRSFLNYIYLNGGWTGPDITWDPNVPVDENGKYDEVIRRDAQLDMNEFARRMEDITMAELDEDVDANVDRPWRDVE
ncbi:hypothetical protein D9613_008723 [Agrocybe pediades]|uniref:RNA helicase n=1 Tax=Agrocybe pediades TaxID=84607 RepID=A0A8H4QUJ0_9AGAR|nr:hypothetical protein D9613_008723 [Agrocybe pediades]